VVVSKLVRLNNRVASWMGGDRDGNPFVTSKVTEQVVLYSRWRGAALYYQEVDKLMWELSSTKGSPELIAEVAKLDKKMKEEGDTHKMKFFFGSLQHGEPYRFVLAYIRRRLWATKNTLEAAVYNHDSGNGNAASGLKPVLGIRIYDGQDELMEHLLLLYNSLVSCGDGMLADGRLRDLIRRLSCFGMSLLKLDIRQESERHTEAVDAITQYLGLGSYAEWDEEKRLTFLAAELESKRPLLPPVDDLNFKPNDKYV
jgi:phosphoenolpyruvate carboxylase